jgi:hypothetical protein
VLTEDPASTPAPTPTSTPIRYNVSGSVTDEDGLPVANAELTLSYDNSFKSARTSTDARGHYSIAFESQHTTYGVWPNARVVAAIFYTGGGAYENYYVQAVPWGTADVVKNLRLRRVRTVNAGESIAVSIDPDSSLAYDGEDWLRMDWMWEKFHVRVADAGTLTVEARPEAGGIVPEMAVLCIYVTDNCRYREAPGPRVPGRRSLIVDANSLFEIRMAIPSPTAPQRYAVATSHAMVR